MTAMNTNVTVGALVAERPARARVFERLGIDYCCGGRKPLAEVCAQRGLDAKALLAELTLDTEPADAGERDWSDAPLAVLCDHIEATHHAYLRFELPRLGAMTRKVATVHGEREPHLRELAGLFGAFHAELDAHMAKEEQVLFPIIRKLEEAHSLPSFHCGSVANPIRMMEHEHDNAGDALARMRALTRDYTPPPEACNTYRAMLDGLQELEKDMHQHVHKENNILFPRAAEREQFLAAKRADY